MQDFIHLVFCETLRAYPITYDTQVNDEVNGSYLEVRSEVDED